MIEQGAPNGENGAAPDANFDPAEVAKFEAMAARWWDEGAEMAPLHAINALRTGFIAERARLQGCKALDVGCGGGILSEALARLGAEVTGLDAASSTVAVARLHAMRSGLDIEYTQSTAEEYARASGSSFDIVTCMELLEHVPRPESLVHACAKLVRPGGSVFFSTINRTPKAFAFAVIGAEYVLRLLPKGTHEFARFLRPSELDNAARAAGLDLAELCGMRYDPFTGNHTLVPSLDVNYIGWFRAR